MYQCERLLYDGRNAKTRSKCIERIPIKKGDLYLIWQIEKEQSKIKSNFYENKIVASETLIAEEQQKLEGYKLELKKWQVHKKNLEKLFQEIDNDV